MWRAFFMALAITLIILGVECLVVKKAVLASEVPAPAAPAGGTLDYLDGFMAPPAAPAMVNRVVEPPEWAPWSLLSGGAIVLLYAMSMNKSGE